MAVSVKSAALAVLCVSVLLFSEQLVGRSHHRHNHQPRPSEPRVQPDATRRRPQRHLPDAAAAGDDVVTSGNDSDSSTGKGRKMASIIPGDPAKDAAAHGTGARPILIPHILHQTWDGPRVPRLFAPWMRSWTRHHPNWEYWFWTQEDVRRLLARYHPDFLPEYDAYERDVYRANVMRFFIMYHFGGVYADLDLESLRPMDAWTVTYNCILPLETLSHPVLLRRQDRSNPMITLLACRPHHPFYKLAIDMLPIYKTLPYNNKLLFIDQLYVKYNASRPHAANDSLTMAHPDLFLPTFDRGWTAKIRQMCLQKASLPTRQAAVCSALRRENFKNNPKNGSYTNHHWVHVVMKSGSWKKNNAVPIETIMPQVKNISLILEHYPP